MTTVNTAPRSSAEDPARRLGGIQPRHDRDTTAVACSRPPRSTPTTRRSTSTGRMLEEGLYG